MNPLLEQSSLDYQAVEFSKIKESHFIEALDKSILKAKENIEKIKEVEKTDFSNTIEALEVASDQMDNVVEIFYGLYGAHCTDELSELAEDFNTKLTNFSSDLCLDNEVFAAVKSLYDQKKHLDLTKEQSTVLENHYKDFVRNGALLSEEDKEKLREIDQTLSKLSLKFSENMRKASNEYSLIVDDKSRLKGLPENVIATAFEAAKEKGHEGKYVFTLDYPSYVPLMTYCEDRELRKELWTARQTYVSAGKFDNRQVIIDILKFRKKRAQLLGYKDHPSFVLEERMAQNPENVMDFIKDLSDKCLDFAKKDIEKVRTLKHELTNDSELTSFDFSFYAEKLKKKELDFDTEELRPYFKLENVLEGAFLVAQKLFGIKFEPRDDLPVYHQDVKVFEVTDDNGEFIGLFYGDYFPRKEKRSGAWMTTYRQSGLQFGEVKRPIVTNVCNLTKPSKDKPSLLSLDEVRTIFHELGHGLHGLLSKTKYKSVSGTNVHWDFVELPSQVMENWLNEKECLDLFAKHYETGETIPAELVKKIASSGQFMEGYGCMRQMRFASLDMAWHLVDPDSIDDVKAYEEKAIEKFDLLDDPKVGVTSCSFGHIFAGGYSSGYYSYKWAEVLDADAFAYFKEKGIFNKEIGLKFRKEVLEKGGSEPPMDLYINFRGQKPSVDALMQRSGFTN